MDAIITDHPREVMRVITGATARNHVDRVLNWEFQE